MERTIGIIVRLLDDYQRKHPELETSSSLNFVVTDGRTTIATRFRLAFIILHIYISLI